MNKKAQATEIPLKEMSYMIIYGVILLSLVAFGYGVFYWLTNKPLELYQQDLERINKELLDLDPGEITSVPITTPNFVVYIFDEDYVKQNKINQCKDKACICAKKGQDQFYCKPLLKVKKECDDVCIQTSVQEHQINLEKSLNICRKGSNNNELKLEC